MLPEEKGKKERVALVEVSGTIDYPVF